MKLRRKLGLLVASGALLAVTFSPTAAQAALTPSLSQVINAGTQSVDIVNGNGVSVGTPSVSFSALNFSFDCQQSTGTLGFIDGADATKSQIISIKNPKKAGVKLDLNATEAVTGKWTNVAGDSYKFNDPTAAGSVAGCANGQLAVSGGTFTQKAGSGTPTTSTVTGTPAFTYDTGESTTPSITIFNNTSAVAYNGELTGYTLTQQVPGSTPEGTYSLPMTITATPQ